MSLDDENTKNSRINGDDSDEDESGTGGQSGQIAFHDFLSSNNRYREDQLSFEDRKRLLSVHKDTHQIRVKKQKELREQRKDLKEGKIPLRDYRQGLMGMGMNSQYKINPILANKAQFSGIDRQVNGLPNENVADTNLEKREDLEYQYSLRYSPENAPRFNPKPKYR